jgi:hypothetical protein
LYIFSSAVRYGKRVDFSIDGWDIYEYFWLPRRVHRFEAWGPFFFRSLTSRGIGLDRIWIRGHPFRTFKMREPEYITVYEAPKRQMDLNLQVTIIKILAVYAKQSNLKVRVKLLVQSKIREYLQDFENVKFYLTGVAYQDSANSVEKLIDELSEVVPDTALFVALGLSHGIVEFGVNNLPVVCFQQSEWESQGKLNRTLESCGVKFIGCSPLPPPAEISCTLTFARLGRLSFLDILQ